MISRTTRRVISVSCCLVTAMVHAEQSSANDPDADAIALRPLVSRWKQAMHDLHEGAMAVAVVRGDKVVLSEPFGVRNVATGQPVTRDTVFYIASSTKSFTAMAVCMLADQGKVDLDAPVKRYLPRFQLAAPEYTSSVTVRDLLSHRLGLRSAPITFGEAFSGQMNEQRFYRLLADVRPRGRFGYSNLHFTLAGRIIESVSGVTWKQFVTNNILEPIGMTRSYCSADKMYALSDVAMPMIEDDGRWKVSPTRKIDATMHAAGGMGCSITDLATWVRLNLNGGEVDGRRIISKQRCDEMQTPQTQVGSSFYEFQRKAYGLGWYVGTYQNEELIHHFGGFAGARAHVSFMPQHGIGVAVLSNQGGNFTDLVACDVYDALLGLTHKRDLLVTFKKRDKQRRANRSKSRGTTTMGLTGLSLHPIAYLGTYANDDWGTLQVNLVNGRLRMRIGNVQLNLVAGLDDRFRTALLPDTPPADAKFVITNAASVSAIEFDTPNGLARFVRK